jgi:hypothetical protein
MAKRTHRLRVTLIRKDIYLMTRWWLRGHGYNPKKAKAPTNPEEKVECAIDFDEVPYRRLLAEKKRRLAENLPRATFSDILADLADKVRHSTPAAMATARFRRR